MPRKRLIDPNYWSDDKIIKISIPARLLFIAMWNFTDDLGVHRNDNYTLKAEVFPLDDLSIDDIEKYKQELIKAGLVIAFTDEQDGNLLFIKNWYKYQYIKKPTPSKYILPNEILQFFNEDELEKYQFRIANNDYHTSTVPVPPKRKEKNRIERKRKEKNVKELLKEKENDDIDNNPFKQLQQYLPSNQNK